MIQYEATLLGIALDWHAKALLLYCIFVLNSQSLCSTVLEQPWNYQRSFAHTATAMQAMKHLVTCWPVRRAVNMTTYERQNPFYPSVGKQDA